MATEKRPQAVQSITIEEKTSCGPIYVTIGHIDSRIIEVFATTGKAGGCSSAIVDGMTRMISYGLRAGMEPERVIKGLGGIQCHQGANTCCNAISEAVQQAIAMLREMYEEKAIAPDEYQENTLN